MNISIVIPNYNGGHLLQKNMPKVLDAVRNYKDGIVEIIIADDCSPDNSRSVIKKFVNENENENVTIKTVENDIRKETGFSKNVNRGARAATGDILILLNSDVAPHRDFLGSLLKHFEDEKVFAVGCMDESIENGQTVLRGRGIGEFARGFLAHRRGEVDKNSTLWVSGGSSAFRKNIWDKLKGFDVLYNPFYWEDIDLSYRALKSGYKIIFEPKSIVVHEHEEGAIKKKFTKKYIKSISYRNQFLFIWKNVTDPALLASYFLWLPYHFFMALMRGDWAFFRGFLEASIKLRSVLSSRDQAKRMFVKSDRDVIEDCLK